MTGGGDSEYEITNVNIIPLPQYMSTGDVTYNIASELTVSYHAGLENEVSLLTGYLDSDFGIKATADQNNESSDIRLVINPELDVRTKGGYHLKVAQGQMLVTAEDNLGIFYGLQTLRQIIVKNEDKFCVKELVISDYPSSQWRSVMLDEGRYFKGAPTVKTLIDEMARLKFNIFHWHLTEDQGWRIEMKGYPKLIEIGSKRDSTQINNGPDWSWVHNEWDGVPHSGHYTQADIKEIVAYAKQRHVDIVPEIEILTHASAAIASYQWLGTTGREIKVPVNLGVFHEVMDISKPEVMKFIHDVLDETIALFPFDYIHVGGDEMHGNNWKNSQGIQKMMSDLGLTENFELQIYFFNNISKYLESKGKKMVGWSDFIGKPGVTSKIELEMAPGTIAQYWMGDINMLNHLLRNDLLVVQSHTDFAYFNTWLDIAHRENCVPLGVDAARTDQIVGLGAACWSEFDPTPEKTFDHIFPLIAAYAETGWSKASTKDFKSFLTRLQPMYDKWEAAGIDIGGTEERP